MAASGLEAEINRLETTIFEMRNDLDKFSFQKIDQNITKELVEDIGSKIAKLNQELYVVEQRLSDIRESLKSEFSFDLEQVKELFDSIELHLPNAVTKSYEDLIELNKQMTKGRTEHLLNAKENLSQKLYTLSEAKDALSKEQEKLSDLLIEKESFKKYKMLRNRLSSEESELAVLKERLEKLDSATELRLRLSETKQEEESIVQKLQSSSRQSNNNVIKSIVSLFSEYVKDILLVDAFFYFTFNKEGNPHFQIGMADATTVEEGHTFNKVMAACFDLSLLTYYSNNDYYRFAYHDGLLESLEDRVKLRLIDTWRQVAENNRLQLIVTVLDTDIPENEDGSKQYFKANEIIRELHDQGKDGRLFRMNKF